MTRVIDIDSVKHLVNTPCPTLSSFVPGFAGTCFYPITATKVALVYKRSWNEIIRANEPVSFWRYAHCSLDLRFEITRIRWSHCHDSRFLLPLPDLCPVLLLINGNTLACHKSVGRYTMPLYDEIRKDGTTSGWSNDDYKCFIDYYKAIDFAAYCRLQKKYQPKTAHNTFFLILYEMGMDDKDVRRIMGVTQEAIRSTRYRIQQGGKK